MKNFNPQIFFLKLTNDNIGSDTVQQKTWMIEKDVIKEHQPIVLRKDLAKHRLHQGPGIILARNLTRSQMPNQSRIMMIDHILNLGQDWDRRIRVKREPIAAPVE